MKEASDSSAGASLAERLRSFCATHSITGDLEAVAKELEFEIPPGKDMVDCLVKLRNSAAHNGKIDEQSLLEYNGRWLLPLIEDKQKLHKLVGETIRYLFCCIVGHSRDIRATKIELQPGEVFEFKFD